MGLIALLALLMCATGMQMLPKPLSSGGYGFGAIVGGTACCLLVFLRCSSCFWRHAGQYFAKQGSAVQTNRPRDNGAKARQQPPTQPPLSTVPLNGLGQWINGDTLKPLANGVFASGTVERMVRNASTVFVVGSFQWTRCKVRSCGNSDSSGFSDRRVLRNLALYDFGSSKWSGVGLGCAGYIRDVHVYGDTVLIGGNFSQCFNEPGVGSNTVVFTKNVASWTKKGGWVDLGGERFVGQVTSVTRDPKTGFIYAVGSSTGSQPDPFVFLQVFNGAHWAVVSQLSVSIGTNSFNVVRCYGDWVYVGGSFPQFGNDRASNVVALSTLDLSVDTLNSGVSGPVYDIVQYSDGSIIVGGDFDTANAPVPTAVHNLAIYSKTQERWDAFGDFHSAPDKTWQVRSLDSLPDGALVAAGYFGSVGNGTVVNNIAVFTEGKWEAVGEPNSDAPLAPFTVYSAVFTGQDEVLAFGYSGSTNDNILASYLQSEGWVFELQALLETGTVGCAAVSEKHGLVIGGSFVSNGTAAVRSLAIWNDTMIVPLGTGVLGQVNGLDFVNDWLYVVGAFRVQGDTRGRVFARLDMPLQKWEYPELPPGSDFLSFDPFRCVHSVGKLVFVGGSFSFPQTNTSNKADMLTVYIDEDGSFGTIAPGATVEWSPKSTILALADNSTHLFVAGAFRVMTDFGVFYNLACLDIIENQWVDMAKTCDSEALCAYDYVNSVAWINGALYVGGNFSYIGSGEIRTQVNNVAYLVGHTWKAVGPGLPGSIVSSVAVFNTTGAVMMAGEGSGPSVVVVAAGNGLLSIYSEENGDWEALDPGWTFRVSDVLVVLPFYFAQPLLAQPWAAYAIALAVLMAAFCVVGLIIVIILMRRRGRSGHLVEYSLLDVSTQLDDDAWLVDYESLKIHNPPIGKGAYSVVNRAVLKGTVVAVKTFVGQDYYGDIRADFNREIALLTRLRHPNIILFIGACRTPLCIITELAERGCLYDVIHQTPEEMTWARIKSIALDSCRGLAYLHNQTPPLLHRDLKSANVLISESFVAKISDFGIAKRLAIHTMTMRVGTTRWMAPEVLTNKGSTTAYSLGSDVYSFAVVVWEMLTLQLPWGKVSFDHQIEDRVTAGEHLPIPDATPQSYRTLMENCFNFDAQQRPPFTQLIFDIDSIPYIEGSPERDLQ